MSTCPKQRREGGRWLLFKSQRQRGVEWNFTKAPVAWRPGQPFLTHSFVFSNPNSQRQCFIAYLHNFFFFDKFYLHQGHKISDHNTVAILELSTNIPGDDRVSSPIMPPDEKFVWYSQHSCCQLSLAFRAYVLQFCSTVSRSRTNDRHIAKDGAKCSRCLSNDIYCAAAECPWRAVSFLTHAWKRDISAILLSMMER